MATDSEFTCESGPTGWFEEEARRQGYRRVAGLDEAGRGPLAGPVVGAAVILPRRCTLAGLDDSKRVLPEVRDRVYDAVIDLSLSWAIGIATETEIDALNILQATRLAWKRALANLSFPPDFLLIDATIIPGVNTPQRAVVKGDQLSLSIAAASILAKVHRDRLMMEYHQRFPRYRFDIHKGYPTPEHLRLLSEYGPCPLHRQSFRPVSQFGQSVPEEL